MPVAPRPLDIYYIHFCQYLHAIGSDRPPWVWAIENNCIIVNIIVKAIVSMQGVNVRLSIDKRSDLAIKPHENLFILFNGHQQLGYQFHSYRLIINYKFCWIFFWMLKMSRLIAFIQQLLNRWTNMVNLSVITGQIFMISFPKISILRPPLNVGKKQYAYSPAATNMLAVTVVWVTDSLTELDVSDQKFYLLKAVKDGQMDNSLGNTYIFYIWMRKIIFYQKIIGKHCSCTVVTEFIIKK